MPANHPLRKVREIVRDVLTRSPGRRVDDSLYQLESAETIMRGRFTDQGGLFSYIAPDKRQTASG
jgi:hypothetical protein